MRWNDRRCCRVWLLAVAVAFFSYGAGAQDDTLDDGLGEYQSEDVSVDDEFGDDLEGDRGESELAEVSADDGFADEELPAVSSHGGPRTGIETITVTAQKRSQSHNHFRRSPPRCR